MFTNTEEPKSKISLIYNLILLDASWSMNTIKKPTIDGYNEVIQTIQNAAKEHTGQRHTVTLVTFSNKSSQVVLLNKPVDQATELTEETYKPLGGTPLYDTMASSINILREYIPPKGDDYAVIVTVITDGEDTTSTSFTAETIHKLVEQMKLKNWSFSYIGANHDVTKAAKSMGFDASMSFMADDKGTEDAFKTERYARTAFYSQIAHGASLRAVADNMQETYSVAHDQVMNE